MNRKGMRSCVAFVALLLAAVGFAQGPADPQIKKPSSFDPNRPSVRELQTNVPDGFTLVTVGDCIISRPLSQESVRDEGFRKVIDLLRQADVTYGNMETSIIDIRHFHGSPNPGPDDVTVRGEPGVAKDLADMGFDIMSRANNHALDWGLEGMRETSHWLESAGIVYAGVGENLGLAQAPGYYESPKGRIAIISMASTFTPGSSAMAPAGAAPSRPGVNALNLTKSVVVTPEQMARVVAMRDALFPGTKDDPAGKLPGELTLLGTKYVVGSSFGFRYEMDATDLAGILRAVRLGKQHSDFLIVTIHSHEPAASAAPDPKNDFADRPAGFLHDLAHQVIDSGADVFITTGIHHLGPIEIYKGRPIFYGLANFFWGDIQDPVPADLYRQYQKKMNEAFDHPERATDADFNSLMNGADFAGQPPFDAVLAQSRFVGGKLAELKLYPVDLGYGRKLTESGTPRRAGPDQSQRILRTLQELSTPFGTKIVQESGVGVIRP